MNITTDAQKFVSTHDIDGDLTVSGIDRGQSINLSPRQADSIAGGHAQIMCTQRFAAYTIDDPGGIFLNDCTSCRIKNDIATVRLQLIVDTDTPVAVKGNCPIDQQRGSGTGEVFHDQCPAVNFQSVREGVRIRVLDSPDANRACGVIRVSISEVSIDRAFLTTDDDFAETIGKTFDFGIGDIERV